MNYETVQRAFNLIFDGTLLLLAAVYGIYNVMRLIAWAHWKLINAHAEWDAEASEKAEAEKESA